jgi:hypothetical protein
MHTQFGSNNFALDTVDTVQDDPAPFRHRARYTPAPDLPFQIFASLRLQNQSRRWPAIMFAMMRSPIRKPHHTMMLISVPFEYLWGTYPAS